VIITVESRLDKPIAHQRQDDLDVLQMKGRFREYGFAGEERLGDLLRHLDGPVVMIVVTIGERDKKAGVCDAVHERENPFRDERLRAPLTDPARRINRRSVPPAFASSSCSRTIRPWDTPVLAAVSSSCAGMTPEDARRQALMALGGIAQIALGLGVGIVAAFALLGLLGGLLVGRFGQDPLTLAVSAGFLFFVAMVSMLWPIWRATSRSPVIALRYE
jgi:hypothetical protein